MGARLESRPRADARPGLLRGPSRRYCVTGVRVQS